MTPRTLPLCDGAPVRLIEAGPREPGRRDAVLLIHGVGMRAEAWAPQIDALSQHFRVVAVDMPGHGGSAPLPPDAQLPDFVAWAARLIEALALGPVNLAGHSMGALVAAGLAVERPDLVRRLALLNAVHRRDPQARAAVLARADQIAQGRGDATGPLSRWFGRSGPAIRNRVAGWLEAVDPQGYATAYRAFATGDATYADRLSQIACPTLVLTGEGDQNSTPQMSRDMAGAIPQATPLIVAGHRHMVNLTAPYIVTDALKDWLQRPVAADDAPPPLDPRALRDAFGCFMTGVTVVTTLDRDGKPLGFTANSFSSVSLDPPMVLVSIARTSRNSAHFQSAAGFAVNILSETQKDISATFARPGEDRFATIGWAPGPCGAPVIEGVSAWFDCAMAQVVEAGDHAILIGRVEAFAASKEPGLGYYRGAYITPAATSAQMPAGPEVLIQAIIECAGAVLMIDDGQAGLSLPQTRVGRQGLQPALQALLDQTSPGAAAGEIYAVYEGETEGRQHIAFRCPTTTTSALRGSFVPLDEDRLQAVADPASAAMLRRLVAEVRLGDYGVYFGSHAQGQVTRKQATTGKQKDRA
ncbi:alpha/beta fold hydrolase [Paracoccus nototheniae]|uniref:Alpha/beta fold hydrolase n=1 Tax=Paracoccus nototheniae TaxID=2489002 RepID=A0ABW4E137_9RHOB|nr:alpha/beta fold hydrolase [Paracoccus nototheniae]